LNQPSDQVVLEERVLGLSVEIYRQRNLKNRERGMETVNNYGKRALSMAVTKVAERVEQWLDEVSKKPGRRARAHTYISQFRPAVAAVYACKVMLDGVSSTQSLQAVASNIGLWLQYEANAMKLAEEKPGTYKVLQENLKKNPLGLSVRVKQGQTRNAAKKAGVELVQWSATDRTLIGLALVDLVIESTGWFELQPVPARRRGLIYQLKTTPAFQETIAQYTERDEVLHPLWVPMIVPPRDWTGLYGGGYYTTRLQRPLVKIRSKAHREAVEQADLTVPIQAVNAMQRTPWRINRRVLDVMKQAWESGMDLAGLPPKYDRPIPPKVEFTLDPEGWKTWKKNAGEVFRRNRKDDSLRTQVERILRIAGDFVDYERIYFPYQLDFRGRMYATPQLLNPQGADWSKGLLEFADAKPLGEDGVQWLAVHLANSYGEDKVSFSDRRKWVMEHESEILKSAMSPLEFLWWTDADKPWQFLAAAFAWADYRRDGPGAISGVPVYFDGSANGLQHYAAMLRDEIAGREVNLVPQPKPADLYASVATVVEGILRGRHDEPHAAEWLSFGIDRSAVKRPVMVLPYGGTRDATFKYLKEWYQEQVDDNGLAPLAQPRRAVQWLTPIVWEAMKVKTAKAREAMDWLRQAARKVGKKPIVWTTPTGFVAWQAYPDLSKLEVKTHLVGKVIRVRLLEVKDETQINVRKQAQAIAPNFVHSYDASALAFTVLRAEQEGLTHFSAIHDSFGTLPSDSGKLMRILREEFHRLYADRDPLKDLATELGIDLEPPARGSLDLDLVLDSPFLFS
jgi:DNA-directed RNA polymerase